VHTAERRGLLAYMWSVVAVAAPLIVLVATQALSKHPSSLAGRSGLIVGLFCVVLIIGEMWPIPVARGREAGDEITVSSTFGFALLLIAPVFIAIAAQALALIIDCVVRGRPRSRLPFNIAQYSLAFICARLVYSALAGQSFTPPDRVPAPEILAALAAATAFLLVNNLLVGCAVAISVQLRLHRVLVEDLAWQISTSAPLLGLGPLAAQAMSWTPWSIILLLVPIAALHRSGSLAMRREQEALRDTLTGLANRTMLTSATERALSTSVGQTAMLLLDLDHFKDINDTLGHAVGDQMLVSVAERLTAQAGPNDLVGRLGGDEFVVLQRSVTNFESVIELAERLCKAVREPVVLHGVTLTVGCSLGIAFAPDHADSVADLLRCADIALYSAKDTRGTATVYDKTGDRHSAALLGLHADLRSALENEHDTQLWVAYQPQLDLASGRITSVECLARWRHPFLGEVAPDTFVPIAESASLIDMLLHRVLVQSLRQLAEWDDTGLHLSASVNLSARHLSDMSLPDTISRQLQHYGISANRLVLEVTESRLMADPEHSAHILRQLHNLGIQISIDDFGTGYSSLSYLQRLAADELKIDKSFTAQLGEPGNATIVRSTIDLGHNLGLRVVAEGVEDQQTADRLAEFGCDLLQGYFIGRPVAALEIPILLAASLPPSPQHISNGGGDPNSTSRRLELVPRSVSRAIPATAVPLEKAE
jgi:diguanylate cyclase (GGDEF)-like protein